MPTRVGVSLRTAGSLHHFDPGDLDLETGDWVVVPTPLGLEIGQVVGIEPAPSPEPPQDLPQVLRRAHEQDLQNHLRGRIRAAEALALSRERVRHHGLDMKMLQAETSLDGNRILLYFSAESRVDFRVLVRDLSSALHKRIELRQIGPRDRSGLTGGLGPCGRECCCSSWTREFCPVSIKMAKEQNLSLNPTKISGSCGRLMCCLRYEYQAYRELRRGMPRIGETLELPEGPVRVVAINLGRCSLKVEHPAEGLYEIPPERLKALGLGLSLPLAGPAEPGEEVAPPARSSSGPERRPVRSEQEPPGEKPAQTAPARPRSEARRPRKTREPARAPERPRREGPPPERARQESESAGSAAPDRPSEPGTRRRPRRQTAPPTDRSEAPTRPGKRRPRKGRPAGQGAQPEVTSPKESPSPEARESGRGRRRGRGRRSGGRGPAGPAPEKPTGPT